VIEINKLTILNRKIKNYILRFKLKNKDFSIISSNCNGGIIMSDLGVKFNSPTVNLFFYPSDFIKFVKNIKEYLSYEIVEVKDTGLEYPVGDLNGVKIHFMHYDSFEEAKNKWEQRKQRVNYNNLFIMFTDRDGCTYENIKEFDELPYKNKVIFTNKPYKKFKSAYYIEGFESEDSVGILSEYIDDKYVRYLYKFDIIGWLNNN